MKGSFTCVSVEGSFLKILNDRNKAGDSRPWKEKKELSRLYGRYLSELGYKKAERVLFCGEYLEFAKLNEDLRLHRAFFCKSKLCALCSWRRAMKNSWELQQILEVAYKRYPKARFLFLTLTEENADFGNLEEALKTMQRSIYKLFQYKDVRLDLIGYARATEITINSKKKTYHQHMHCLLMVKSTYFKKGHYLSQDDWSKLWQKARKLDYKPIVNIQTIKPSKKDGKLVASAKEVAKYQVKSADYLTGDEHFDKTVIDELEKALKGKRQISFGLLFKEIRSDLKLEEKEDDLIHVDDELDTTKTVDYVVYKWNEKFSNYVFFKSGKIDE